jgi:hypothetical protein
MQLLLLLHTSFRQSLEAAARRAALLLQAHGSS